MSPFAVAAVDDLVLDAAPALQAMVASSPFVWRNGAVDAALVRFVPPRAKGSGAPIARIHAAVSNDGLRFVVNSIPTIAAGPAPHDAGGAGDPTAVPYHGGIHVFYAARDLASQHTELAYASGPSSTIVRKRGIAIARAAERADPKRPTVVRLPDGSWHLFFAYEQGGVSRVGLAKAPALRGPWTVVGDPFVARHGSFDSAQLSPGPAVCNAQRLMFYDGAGETGEWTIGWIAFDETWTHVVARCDEPLIASGPQRDGDPPAASAASAIDRGDRIDLYYTVAGRSMKRARVVRKSQ